MPDAILALNAGSTTIKFGLFEVLPDGPRLLCKGLLDEHSAKPRLRMTGTDGRILFDKQQTDRDDETGWFEDVLNWVEDYLAGDTLLAIGHRIVHGGPDFVAPVVLDDATINALASLTPLAPLHQPRCLSPVRLIMSLRPDLPQIACFDTAFHRNLGPLVRRFAIPRRFDGLGVRRYGFHGLSYQYIADRLAEMSPELAAKRTVVAHLGSGSSLCAMRDGISIDTTMGMTALDGLMMATRCGSIDPGVLLHLQKAGGMSVDALERILYEKSGLMGVSGLSADMRVLIASDMPHAIEAVDMFVTRAAKEICGMAVSLNGLECLVFTGGIGEHSAEIRARICAHLGWIGIVVDQATNGMAAELIAAASSAVDIRVVPTSEETTIARDCARLLAERH